MENNILDCPFCISYKTEIDKHPLSSKNLLILQSNPDVEYYCEPNDNLNSTPYEHHLFAIVEPAVCFEVYFYKALAKTIKIFDKKPNIYLGQMKINNDVKNIIRFREDEISETMELIEILKTYGFKFHTSKKFHRTKVEIHYKKHIHLEQIEPDIYKDANSKHVYLIRLPYELDFKNFITLVKELKNNCNFALFEPYFAFSLKENLKCHCFFMIYSPHCQQEKLKEFKEVLYKKMEIFEGV